MSDLRVTLTSSNLKDVAFVYADANGTGSFTGSVSGRIAKPLLNGEFTLENHKYREWQIQHADGGVRLDMETENAAFRNVRITQGESQVLVNGTAHLSGTPVDLRAQSNRVVAQDLKTFVNLNIAGVFAGDAHITSLIPAIKLEGDLRADNLSVDNRFIGNARGHVRYFEPVVDIEQLTVQQNGSTLTGDVSFNRSTDAVKFTTRVNSVNLQMFYALGLPDSVQGIIRQADIRGEGTTSRPNIRGNATLQNLSVAGEVFPQARVDLSSTGTKLDVQLDAGRNLNASAQIDTAAASHPFTAHANPFNIPWNTSRSFQKERLTRPEAPTCPDC
jgi:autotransporter translocation and assembly factor TamB